MDIKVNYENSIANRGNQYRLKNLMKAARDGGDYTIGFLGGSITQGSVASRLDLCYAYHVYEWWCDHFPRANFSYINAGIGATDSQFGCARVDQDLLCKKPDFVVVEYSVNDASNEHYLETYEGVVRKIYNHEQQPAVLLVHNVCYDTGANAQLQHGRIARYYQLPAVSMQSSIFPEIVSGRLDPKRITSDFLHPNDLGHELVADIITHFLEKVLSEVDQVEEMAPMVKETMTANAYEDSIRYRSDNAVCVSEGFDEDISIQCHITDIFKNGWFATKKGSKISFYVEGGCIGIQYRKTMQLPAPVAEVRIDGKKVATLDANFDETWGDKLVLDTILEHGSREKHTVEIELVETHPDDRLPFYLVSVIGSQRFPGKKG